jgi:hypothetical protein
MHSSLIVAVLVAMGQIGGAGSPQDTPRYSAENTPPAERQPWDISPVTPPGDTSALPAEQPASGELTNAATEIKPSALLRSLADAPPTGQLAGSPITLSEAITGSATRLEQTARVAAYWELSTAVTDYYLALREATELDTLRQGISRPSFAWDEARLAQSARVEAARLTAEAAQYRLQNLLKRAAGELPLPSDLPHCGAYETRYQENFTGRDSADALELSELIPQLHQELRNQTASVEADRLWLQSVSQQRDPQSDGNLLLKAYELLTLRRREFVRGVSAYNIQIARYTQMASPGQVETDRLVAMLIETTPTNGGNSAITRTSAEEPIDSESPQRIPPRTFAEEDPPAAQPQSVPNNGEERSILVRPQ